MSGRVSEAGRSLADRPGRSPTAHRSFLTLGHPFYCYRYVAPRDHPDDPPTLGLGQRASLHDFHRIAGLGIVVLVMGMANGTVPQVLAVLRMPHQAFDLDAARLGHLVAGHHADGRLANPPRAGHRSIVLLNCLASRLAVTLALDGLNAGDFAPRLADFTGSLDLFRLRLEPEAEQVLGRFAQGQRELFVAH